jgi:hypothetical protein
LTFNMTLATPGFVIQASDRRMVSVPDGKVFNDDANKGLVIKADDGVFSITFAGIGSYYGKRVDHWLAEKSLDEGVPELPISRGVQIISKLATDWFTTFPKSLDKRHSFIIAGWEKLGNDSRAVAWRISNSVSENEETPGSDMDTFHVKRFDIKKGRALLYITGLTGAFSRDDRRIIEALLKTEVTLDKAEEALVDNIRRASSNPKWSWGINGNVRAILVDWSGKVRATQYPISGRPTRYIPLCMWYEAGRNYVAGDGWCSTNWTYRIGPIMYIMPPSPPVDKHDEKVDFLIRFSEAKHKKDAVRDIEVIKAYPNDPMKSAIVVRTPKA